MNRQQEKAMVAKRKRTRNTTKRAKLGSHGFKVHKNTKVYIGKATEGGWSRGGKPAPRTEVVTIIRDMINNDPSIKPMRKYIKDISIRHTLTGNIAGTWDDEKGKLVVNDKPSSMNVEDYKSLMVHEVVGHAFWYFSRKWRREELIEFNRLANSLPPVTKYVADNEEKWRKWNDEQDDQKLFEKSIAHIPDYDASEELANEYQMKQDAFNEKRKTNGHDTMTRYANEQHSAISELIYGFEYHNTLINDSDKQRLIEAWKKLHY